VEYEIVFRIFFIFSFRMIPNSYSKKWRAF
jgi:hypothetical protein